MNAGFSGLRSRLRAQLAGSAGSSGRGRGAIQAGRQAWTGFLSRRTARERFALMLGAIAVVAMLYWLLIWQPLSNARAEVLARISFLDRVIATAKTIDPTAVAAPREADIAPATAITDLASQFDITIRRIEPAGAQTSVVLEDVKYETLIAWLDRLEQDYGLRPASVELDRRPEPGVVSAKLVLGS